ncbi:hypothetical protein [Formosa sp. S-31]|uniref:hypothetical protein n=1 Tax=Formosa sp. S-31 TaxID=2790949 RepID=UPI003EB9A83B
MTKLKLLLLYLFPITLTAQSITGKVYDYKSKVKNIGVFNLNSYDYTYTNEDGDFTIKASVNDTILFSSEFYKPQTLIVQDQHFNTINVIEVDILVNTLSTVNLSNTAKFDSKKYQTNLTTQIQNDIKNRPYLYSSTPNAKGDLTLLIRPIIDLFRSKKTKEAPIKSITYKNLNTLFNSSTFFNKTLLTNSLNIKTNHIPLFFDYCDTKHLNEDLLKEQNQIILLDSLMKFSKEFNTRIAEYDSIRATD